MIGTWKEGDGFLEAILRHIYEKKLLGRRTWDLLGFRAKQGGLKESHVTSSSDKVKDDATNREEAVPRGK